MANNVKTVNGIAIASIKNFNGITDANLKNLNGEEFTGTVDIATITSYAAVEESGSAITDGQYGCNMTYDEDNNFVYVQYALSAGGGGAVVGEFN